MTKELFWKIIDEANAETDPNDQEKMLKSIADKLSKLTAKEIASWKNIQTYYIKLADRVDLQQAAVQNNIYLSDDSFYYFRAWLLSKGKDTFAQVLRDPSKLSRFIEDPGAVYFERFSYITHDVYREAAFAEEYGTDGMVRFEQDWKAQNPEEKDFVLYWALCDKYDVYSTCDAYPLSDTEKEQLRQVVFPPTEKVTDIPWSRKNTEVSVVEEAVLRKIPQEKVYRRIAVELNSGYEWGRGMLPLAKERFHQEMKALFTEAGWEYVEPAFDNASPSYRKGNSLLYCHPMELSGPCEESLMSEVAGLLKNAAVCTARSFKDEGRVYQVSDEQYTAILHDLRSEIEGDLLKEFGAGNGVSDSDRCTAVMEKYRIMTLERTTNVLMSSCPYWKCVEEALKNLIKQKKIIEKPDVTRFSSQRYMTAPEIQMRPKMDSQIKTAASRTVKPKQSESMGKDEREL